MDLTPTTALRTALIDAQRPGTEAVTFTRLAIGTGTRLAASIASVDAARRAALRAQTATAVVESGEAGNDTRIALSATLEIAAEMTVTEMGLFARRGAAGEEFLAAYGAEASASAGQMVAAGTRWVQTLVITTSPGTVAVTAGDVDVTVAAPGRITELSDVADGDIAPLALLRGIAAGGRLEFLDMATALNMRTRLFGVASPVGWARIRRGGGGAAIQHRAFSAPTHQVTWMVWLWGAGGGAGRSGSVDGGETRLLGPSPDGSELADTVAVAHGGYNGARYPQDPTAPRVSGVTPGEAQSDDDYGQYLVIQGAGGMGGRESLSFPERGENGALAIRVYRPVPGALYRVHVGIGGSSHGPDGDAGAAMIIEIG